MPNIRDLMISDDALDVEQRFDAILREHNDHQDELGNSFAAVVQREVFDWELDLPENFFDL